MENASGAVFLGFCLDDRTLLHLQERARGKQHIPATPLKPTLNRESYSWQIERRQIAWKAILCVKRMAANTVIMRVLGR